VAAVTGLSAILKSEQRSSERAVGDITVLIKRAHAGDSQANSELFNSVYGDLKRVAQAQVRRSQTPALHTTTLVHEAYFRLTKPESLDLSDRQHFFATAARAMRQLLLDEARARTADKRGGDPLVSLVTTESQADNVAQNSSDVLALEQAMQQLQTTDVGLARLVELRFYAGLELAEIVPLLERSERSLKRDWRKARAFLHAQLSDVKLAVV
jgi:RNA polymerase sigma factor (TIGR02999 family)